MANHCRIIACATVLACSPTRCLFPSSLFLDFLPGTATMYQLWRSSAKFTQSRTSPSTVTSGIAKTSIEIHPDALLKWSIKSPFRELKSSEMLTP